MVTEQIKTPFFVRRRLFPVSETSTTIPSIPSFRDFRKSDFSTEELVSTLNFSSETFRVFPASEYSKETGTPVKDLILSSTLLEKGSMLLRM